MEKKQFCVEVHARLLVVQINRLLSCKMSEGAVVNILTELNVNSGHAWRKEKRGKHESFTKLLTGKV